MKYVLEIWATDNSGTLEKIKIVTDRELLDFLDANRVAEEARKFVVYKLGDEVLDWS